MKIVKEDETIYLVGDLKTLFWGALKLAIIALLGLVGFYLVWLVVEFVR